MTAPDHPDPDAPAPSTAGDGAPDLRSLALPAEPPPTEPPPAQRLPGEAPPGKALPAEALPTEALPPTAAGIARAAALLRAGRTVALPTETVYGLGADARDPQAVAAIYAAKGRPAFNPLIVHVSDLDAATRLARFGPEARRLAEAFWPGPLTLVLPLAAGAGLAPAVTAGLDSVAVRVPAHPVAQALLRAFGGPVAAPSANPSGRISPTTAAHVGAGLAGRIAAVIDAGPCAVGLESTILGFGPAGRPVLLRPGGLPAEALEALLGRPVAPAAQPGAAVPGAGRGPDAAAGGRPGIAAPEATTATGPRRAPAAAAADCTAGPCAGRPRPQAPPRPAAPGQLASHYAPRARLRLNALEPAPGEVWIGFGPDLWADHGLRPGAHPAAAGQPGGETRPGPGDDPAVAARADAEAGTAGPVPVPIPAPAPVPAAPSGQGARVGATAAGQGAAGPEGGAALAGAGSGGAPSRAAAPAGALTPRAVFNLSPRGDLAQAAARLFALLHAADACAGPDGCIAVAPIPETGLGAALNDRLRRAAAPRG